MRNSHGKARRMTSGPNEADDRADRRPPETRGHRRPWAVEAPLGRADANSPVPGRTEEGTVEACGVPNGVVGHADRRPVCLPPGASGRRRLEDFADRRVSSRPPLPSEADRPRQYPGRMSPEHRRHKGFHTDVVRRPSPLEASGDTTGRRGEPPRRAEVTSRTVGRQAGRGANMITTTPTRQITAPK